MICVDNKAKTDHHTAKSDFASAWNALIHAVENKRPTIEVSEAVTRLKGAYESLVHKHDDNAKLADQVPGNFHAARSEGQNVYWKWRDV